ncbi:MAG TPA: nucleotidyltransferase family protein [Acidimicrobiia bacterium]|nr:nucleotidyltransferase family protein [Acidimicrobiia bacterium]
MAALVLAAGGSSRLGRPKQLEPWGATTLLGQVLETVSEAGFEEKFLVLGANSEEILDSVTLEGWTVVENPEWEEGLASSLRVGLDAMTRLARSETAFIFLGDQPDIDHEVISRLQEVARKSKRQAIVPKYRYIWSNPVVVAKTLWPRLMSLTGDEGGKRLLQAHPEWVEEVWFERRPPRDVDTETDVSDLRPRH